MLEIHYDNPEKIANLTFETGINIFYEEKRWDRTTNPNTSLSASLSCVSSNTTMDFHGSQL
jgi:hypothetical protein